jgi:hypothetical protein
MNSIGKPSLAIAAALVLAAAPPAAAQLRFADPQPRLPDLAQAGGPYMAPQMPQAVVVRPRPFRFIVGVGLTGGGDKVATARYYYDDDRNVRAGQLFQIHGGIEWRVAPLVTMQAVAGYHVDGADAYNGAVYFSRYPVELLAHYALAPRWRIGGGLRYTINPKLDGDGVARNINVKYDDGFGPVIEGEFLATNWLGIKLRGAFERFEARDGTGTKSGNHVGIFASFYF